MSPADPARLFGPWAQARGILLAVSGGPDSMALLHLAAQWARPDRPPLFAATVDHGLRAEARAEAELAAAAAKTLGIPHEILFWRGEKPKTGIQEKARTARYGLLFARAATVGADVVMTAHHGDDQAETILFRLLRGSGLAGLAGMKAETARGGMTLARPLLGLRKADLVALCRACGQEFADDPSNIDSRYGRTQMRTLLSALEAQGFGATEWMRLGRRLARADAALAEAAADLAARAEWPGADGGALDLRMLAAAAEEISLRVLALFLEKAGATLPLKLERLEALNARLRQAAGNGAPFAATLAGLRLKLDRNGRFIAAPEGPRRRGAARKAVPPENRLSLLK